MLRGAGVWRNLYSMESREKHAVPSLHSSRARFRQRICVIVEIFRCFAVSNASFFSNGLARREVVSNAGTAYRVPRLKRYCITQSDAARHTASRAERSTPVNNDGLRGEYDVFARCSLTFSYYAFVLTSTTWEAANSQIRQQPPRVCEGSITQAGTAFTALDFPEGMTDVLMV